MMAAYDKKKTIKRSFDRPSFVLDGLDCSDPFATPQTQGTEGVGGGERNSNDDRPHDVPVGDHPGDIPMHEPEIVTKLTQAREDEEEYSPEWIEEMEKLMAAYDKKKKIKRSFNRPSFVLDGFDCPDPFATPQTHGTKGVGGGERNNNDDRPHDVPVGDHPGDDDQPGDIPMHEPIDNDIPDIIAKDAGGAGL